MFHIAEYIVTYTPLIRRVLVCMIGFILSWLRAHTLLHSNSLYSVISRLYSLQSTVAHALGFSVSTSRLLATDLDAQTITV
jgi:hypothetical protein